MSFKALGPNGALTRTDGSGEGIQFKKVSFCGQPAAKYCILGTVCCIPTLSIGTIVACTMMGSAPIVYDLSSANGTAALPRMALVEHSVQSTRGDFWCAGDGEPFCPAR